MDKKIYGNGPELCEREKHNYALAREAAAEGIVLLKNSGVLPLKNKKVALYGMGAVKTVPCGTGSGSVNYRYAVNIADGLKNAGLEVTTQSYLDDCLKEFNDSYKAWHDSVEEKAACLSNPYALFATIGQFEFKYPYGRAITNDDVKNSDTDTAVYVLMRQAGEGNDRKPEKGDYFINDLERNNLQLLTQKYKHLIVVINVGGMIDLSFVDEIKGIEAVVYYTQGGMEGANALGELFAGKRNFSGKLADTWAQSYDDIPFSNEFGSLNGDLDRDFYKEGIYVGYRFFDSFGIKPQYPFGFGLSYTDFDIKVKDVALNGSIVSVNVTVKNIGSVSGKEVVQLYVTHTNNGKWTVAKELKSFAKTNEIGPNKSESLMLAFDVADCAEYEETKAAWVLGNGEYIISIGNSSANVNAVAVIKVRQNIVVAQCRNCCSAEKNIAELDTYGTINVSKDLPEFTLAPEAIHTKITDYDFIDTLEEDAVFNKLTLAEKAELVRGGDLIKFDINSKPMSGSGGKTTSVLFDKGIKNIVMMDGPAGLNVFRHLYLNEYGIEVTAEVPEKYNWSALLKNIPPIPKDATHFYRYATDWPVEMMLAQTWNTELMYKVGCAVGQEMTDFNVDVWLAPALNIHRNPLCGRNFEYLSEDPFLTGKLAAAIIKGVQSHKGKSVAIKHFCCNNREDNRTKMSSDVDEKVLREIYLKGFEIAVKEGKPKTVMSSYNRLNGIYTSNCKDLLTDILRREWGFDGLVMTDWGTTDNDQAVPYKCIAAGNDLIMPGNDNDVKNILSAIEGGELTESELDLCALRVLALIKYCYEVK